MSVDRSLRSTFAAVLLVAALFIAMNRVVASAPLADWWLPLALAIIGAALVPNWNFARSLPDVDEEAAAPTLPGADVHTYRVAAQQVPRLQTMTIRPDPESAEYTVVTISEDTAKGEVLPFIETEVAPSATSTVKTFTTPAAPPRSPTPAPDITMPAAEPKFMSRTEASDPDKVVATMEASVAPAPDDSVTSTPRSEPEKEVIAEKTAAPQQPYEAEQIGTITPERVDQVMNDAPAADAPLVVETASPAITAQERDGIGTVGSPDDLTRLSGIGPKSAAALTAAGIDTFQKLASASDEQLRAAVAGIRLVGDVTSWASQAAYAARGDWAGLDQLKATLRRPSSGD